MKTHERLLAALNRACSAADIIDARTRIEWHNRDTNGRSCPNRVLASIEALKAWVSEAPDEPVEFGEIGTESIEAAHQRWLQDCKGTEEGARRPLHPLTPTVKAWCDTVVPERRATGILPEPFRDVVPERSVDSSLPTTTPVPLLPLAFEGARTHERKHGAPLAKRIWWAAIANTPISTRQPEGSILLGTTLRDVSAWLYPDGRGLRRRELPRLNEALDEVNKLHIDWNGRPMTCVQSKARPTEQTPLDAPLPFRVRLPKGSDRGPLIQLHVLYGCGTISEPVFDAWIRLAYMWDLVKRNHGGRRVYATRPQVLRDEHGRLIDASGELITGPDPAHPASWRYKAGRGRRQGTRGGNRILSWRDSRAVRTGKEERSPAADHVPVLKRTDIHRLLYGAEPVTPGRVKAARRIIDRHFEGAGERERGFDLSPYVTVDKTVSRREGYRFLLPRPQSDQ